MTTKADYTEQEWKLLLLSPTYAGTYVMTADMSVMGVMREMKAMSKAMTTLQPPAGAQELVSAVVSDIEAKAKNKEEIKASEAEEGKDGQDGREPARQGLRQTADLLDQKCSADEAAGFKQWLVGIGQTVAEADKEGSHFGRGGVAVTDKEKTALAEINTYLGL